MDAKDLEQVLERHPEARQSAEKLLECFSGADFNALIRSLAAHDLDGVYASLGLTREQAEDVFNALSDAGKELPRPEENATASRTSL